jgi:hypothetical protein
MTQNMEKMAQNFVNIAQNLQHGSVYDNMAQNRRSYSTCETYLSQRQQERHKVIELRRVVYAAINE